MHFNELSYIINVLVDINKHSEKDLKRGYFLDKINQILTKNKKGRAFNSSDLFHREMTYLALKGLFVYRIN